MELPTVQANEHASTNLCVPKTLNPTVMVIGSFSYEPLADFLVSARNLFVLMPLQPLLGRLLHEIRGGPVQVECRLLDGPNDVRIHGCQELSLLAWRRFSP